MLYFTLEKHKSAKASGALPRTPLGELTGPQDPLAGFKPILYLVVFFIDPKLYANIVIHSLLNEDLHPSDKK